MKIKETWVRWDPIEGLERNHYWNSISNTKDGLKIVVSNEDNQKLEILFKPAIKAYQISDETLRFAILYELDADYGPSSYYCFNFFIVQNSEYLRLLSKQSGGLSDRWHLTHYLIFTDDYLVDIAHESAPLVQWVSE